MTQAWMSEGIDIRGGAQTRSRYRSFQMIWEGCQKCGLGKAATKHCLARGELPCDILFIGEGPGRIEDIAGAPFVGPAGRLLSEWLFELREEFPKLRIALTNLVCCRPTIETGFQTGQNRQPHTHEIQCCFPRLRRFFQLARPKTICLLGRLTQSWRTKLERARFEQSVLHARLLELYHPAFHLRNGRTSETATRDKTKLFDFVEQEFGTLAKGAIE